MNNCTSAQIHPSVYTHIYYTYIHTFILTHKVIYLLLERICVLQMKNHYNMFSYMYYDDSCAANEWTRGAMYAHVMHTWNDSVDMFWNALWWFICLLHHDDSLQMKNHMEWLLFCKNYRSLLQKSPIKETILCKRVWERQKRLWVSFAKEPYKRDNTLQKRPVL